MIIGLCGLKQSGKTTAAAYLKQEHGFKRVNFKDSLIEEMKETLPDVLAYLAEMYKCSVDELFLEKPPLLRLLMQNYGTELRRKEKDDYWVERYLSNVSKMSGEHIATDDVRFMNEVNAIRNAGGVIVRVVNPDIQDGDSHQSEREQSEIVEDFTIYARRGKIAMLTKQINMVLDTIKAD